MKCFVFDDVTWQTLNQRNHCYRFVIFFEQTDWKFYSFKSDHENLSHKREFSEKSLPKDFASINSEKTFMKDSIFNLKKLENSKENFSHFQYFSFDCGINSKIGFAKTLKKISSPSIGAAK